MGPRWTTYHETVRPAEQEVGNVAHLLATEQQEPASCRNQTLQRKHRFQAWRPNCNQVAMFAVGAAPQAARLHIADMLPDGSRRRQDRGGSLAGRYLVRRSLPDPAGQSGKSAGPETQRRALRCCIGQSFNDRSVQLARTIAQPQPLRHRADSIPRGPLDQRRAQPRIFLQR